MPNHPAPAVLGILMFAQVAAAGDAHPEIGVGRTAADRLAPHMHFEQPVLIPRSIFTAIPGFATGLIGFESVVLDEPDADLYTLSVASDLSVRLIDFDAGAVILDNGSPLAAGQSMVFGPPPFDYHTIYNIPEAQTPPGTVLTFRFVLHDATGLYADSDEFTISVTPACPADHNLSGEVSVQDVFDFLAAYFSGFSEADFNRSGAVTVQDIFDFLGAFFTPCP